MQAHNRKRSIDINKLAPSDADRISAAIGDEVRKICDEAVNKANDLLNIYGMKAQMEIVISGLNEKPIEKKPVKSRAKKAANL